MEIITTKERHAITYIIGVTIGAGILALPYVFAQAGFLIGLLELIFVWVIVTLLTLYLGEIVLRTKENHEITGLTEKYLGKKGKTVIVIVSILYIYGALVAYGLGLGEAAYYLFGINQWTGTILVFLVLAGIVYFGLKVVTKVESLLVPFILLIIIAITFSSYQDITVENYKTIQQDNFFLPFGPLFFALLGFWCVPEMKTIIGNKKKLKKSIILGIGICALAYILFVVVVLGVTGAETSELFSIELASYTGKFTTPILHLFTVFAIVTSFLGLGFILKEMFTLDYQFSNTKAWLATCGAPFILLFFVKGGFIDMITVVGAVASMFVLTIVVIMFHKAKKSGDRNPEYQLDVPVWVNSILILFCIIVAVYTVWVYGVKLL